MHLDLYLPPKTKTNSRWITDPNMKGKTIQTVEEHIRKYLCGPEFGKEFLNRILILLISEENHDKMHHTKIKNFFLSKDFINRVKRQATKCDKTCIPDKGCISRNMTSYNL